MKKSIFRLLSSFLWLWLTTLSVCWAGASEKTVAIWDFDNSSFMDIARVDYLKRALAEMFLAELHGVPGLRMVERVHLRKALQEMKLGSNELADQDSRLKLGKLAGAKNMMFGSFIVMDGDVRMDVRVVEVETSLTLTSEGDTVAEDDLPSAVTKMAKKIAKKIGARGQKVASSLIKSNKAIWKLYDKGIGLMDAHSYDEAIKVFQKILEMDAKFKLAESKIVESVELMDSE